MGDLEEGDLEAWRAKAARAISRGISKYPRMLAPGWPAPGLNAGAPCGVTSKAFEWRGRSLPGCCWGRPLMTL